MSEPISGEAGATLTQAVEDLTDAVKALREDLGKRTRRLWWWVAGLVVVGALGLTFVIVRLSVAVNDIRDQQRAACGVWHDLGSVPVAQAQSEIGRKILTDARQAAAALDCG